MGFPGGIFTKLTTDQKKAAEFSFEHFTSVAARNAPRGNSVTVLRNVVGPCFPTHQHVSVTIQLFFGWKKIIFDLISRTLSIEIILIEIKITIWVFL